MKIQKVPAGSPEFEAMLAELQAGGRTCNEQARQDAKEEAERRAKEREAGD